MTGRIRVVDSAVVGAYGYHALGWRVKKVLLNSAGLNRTSLMHYNAA